MGAHRPPANRADPLRAVSALLVVVLAAWALSLLPGAWGLLGFVPVAGLAAAVAGPSIVKGWRSGRGPDKEDR